jgi:hypothetical protein
MAVTSFEVDDRTLALIAQLRETFGVKTNAAVIRKALALANVASQHALSLEKEEKRVVGQFYSVGEQIKRSDARLPRWMAGRVMRTFVLANCVTLAALGTLVVLDEINIVSHLVAPGDRIITRSS